MYNILLNIDTKTKAHIVTLSRRTAIVYSNQYHIHDDGNERASNQQLASDLGTIRHNNHRTFRSVGGYHPGHEAVLADH